MTLKLDLRSESRPPKGWGYGLGLGFELRIDLEEAWQTVIKRPGS
jgi:hypothetical protein